MKQAEVNKLKLLSLEIQKEKELTVMLKNIPIEIEKIESKTRKKILKINVDIMNVDFYLNDLYY